MKDFIKKKLKSILYFIELNFSLKLSSKNPLDVYHEELSRDCYNFFKQNMKSSSIFLKDEDIRKYSIFKAFKNKNEIDSLFLEFGVYKGTSINLFAKFLSQHGLEMHGFDSFEGLEEEWITNEYHPIGTFSLNRKIPKVLNNVKLVKGKVQNTLEDFLNKNIKKIKIALKRNSNTDLAR